MTSLHQLVLRDDHEAIESMIRRKIAGAPTLILDATNQPPLLLYAASVGANKTFEMLLQTRPTLHMRDGLGLGLISYIDASPKFNDTLEVLLRSRHPEVVQLILCAPQAFLDRMPSRLVDLASETIHVSISQTKH